MARRSAAFVLVIFAFVASVLAVPQQPAQQQQQQPAYRAAITVVPIAVRVIDKGTNKPVTDLKLEDFTLLEDDVVQPIRLFERQVLAPDTEAPKAGTRPIVRETPFGVTPQTNRIFLFVLGRGRLQEPSKALDALLHFVRNQLLPQDQVSVFAYDRATDFTTDHEQIAKLVERFRDMHYEINMRVTLETTSGLAAVYGSRNIPKSLQAKIDQMFEGAGLLPYKEIGRGETAATRRAEADSRDQANALLKAESKAANDALNAGGVALPGPLWTSADEIAGWARTTSARISRSPRRTG